MTNTVEKLMALADAYTQAFHKNMQETGNWYAYGRQRQALKDKLTSLFTPLSQSDMVDGFIKHPHETQYVRVFSAGARWAERRHGITGESNDT